jgi:oligogalacturonide lyase
MHSARGWTRRSFFLTIAAARLAAQTRNKLPTFPSDAKRYPDPSTEIDVYRLSSPSYSTQLPAPYARAIASNSSYMLVTCDRAGSPQIFRLDLKNGEMRQLTDMPDIDPATVTLVPDNRAFCFCAGRSAWLATFGLKERELYKIPDGWDRAPGVTVGPDGTHVTLIETHAGGSRMRMISLVTGAPRTVLESQSQISDPQPRPYRAQVLYRDANHGVWLVNQDGQQNRQLKLAAGTVTQAIWAPDGRTVLYLLQPEDRKQLYSIREFTSDTASDKMISKTSQFASFAANKDSSVFAGASENKGSPLVLLLLRMTGNERTLCEHRATNPSAVTLMFSPDSQRLYFQSDREGKPAIYSMHIEKLVEKTNAEQQEKSHE